MFKPGNAYIVTGGVIVVSLGRFIASHELGMPEALVYIAIGCLIVGYWSFSAWLKLREKTIPASPETYAKLEAKLADLEDAQDDTDKSVAAMQTRLNGVSVRMGFSTQ